MHINAANVGVSSRLNEKCSIIEQLYAAILSIDLSKKQYVPTSLFSVFLFCLLLAFPLLSSAAPPNAAPTPPAQVRGLGSSSQIALQNGAFTASTSIDVPAYHGVTPSLSLDYSSSGGNGFFGVGYTLSGFPEIEREYKGGSVVYRFNGEPLIASYALGGSHATLRQSFLRINFYTTTWQIIQPNGTVMTLSQITNNRWGISSVRDAHGVTANYSWSCNVPYYAPNDTCYPSSVNYGTTAITIYKELRTDIDTIATGENEHIKQRYRVNAITVAVGGSPLRTYKLTYTNSLRTGRSLLTNIQQFDRSAYVYADGVVSGGVSLPMSTAAWSDPSTQFDSAADVSNSYGLTPLIWANSIIQNADFNGDGKEDFLLRYTYGGVVTAYLLLANNSGGFNYAVDITNSFGMNSYKWQNAAINPGDFNGDGKQDLFLQVPYSPGQLHPAKYYAYTLIADSYGGFLWLNDIAASTGISAYGWGSTVRVGDFNGDGKSDLLLPNLNNADTSGSTQPTYWASVVYADTYSGFTYASNIPNSSALTSSQWATALLTLADFDGDGYTDVLAQTPNTTNKAFVLLAKPLAGTLFSTFSDITTLGGLTSTDWFCGTITPGDFNGDGKVDIVLRSKRTCVNNSIATPKLLYANGNQGTSFANPINIGNLYGMTLSAWMDSDLYTGDFNGDGKTDLLVRCDLTYLPSGSHRILESKGDGFKTARVVDTSYGLTKELWRYADRIGDFDGDGDDDIFLQVDNRNYKTPPKMLSASGSFGNAITSIANGYGSTTSITYTSSSNWPNNSGNPPRTQTVTSITVSDGRSPSTKTNYIYSGAAWDPVEKRHLGFRYVKATDLSGAYVENTYFQENKFSVGELNVSKTFNSSGGLMSQILRTFTGSSIAPWAKLTMQEAISECNGNGTCKTQQKNYSYDAYGNVTSLIEQGDTAVIGDERNTTYVYTVNPTSFITGLPAEEILRATTGTGITAPILRHKRNYYDGSSSLTSAPQKGDVTRVEQLLSTTGAFIGSNATYDSFGNKLTETDALGATTTTTWEGGHGRFPLSITNALGHTTTLTWNTLCGQKASATDPNQAVTTYFYDGFCRITRELRADGGYTDNAYINFGTANQYVSTTVNDGSLDNNGLGNSQWTVSSFDGLGREWQSFNNSSERIETKYDNRGLIQSVSAPAGAGEPSRLTTYQYDALQRVTRKTFSGGAFQQFLYDDWTVTTCDELGKPRTRYSDAYGQIRKVREYTGKTCALAPGGTLGTDMFDTVINYDLVGQQTGFINAKGYVSSSVFDTLGRRTSRVDPDMGTWNYVYDDKGRLISQTDAKAQTILLSYDVLDRLVQKKTPAGQSLAYFAYDIDVNGIGRRGRLCVNLCSSGLGIGTAYQYDVMGRLVDERPHNNKSYAMNPTVARTYDGTGRVKTLTYPDGEVVTYSYDTAGRLSGMVSSAFASQNIVTAATYNARGSLATRTLGNGVVETFTYDPNRFWLTGVSASLGSTFIHSVSLQRNARGEVTSRSNTLETNDNWTYIYDDLRRMTSATNANNVFWSESFTFDEINRITSSSRLGTYSYGAIGSGKPAYAPQNIGGATLNYDANGNMNSDGVTALVFDVENRPISVGGIVSTYNPDGERTRVGNIYFTHDVREYDGDTGISTNYYLFGESRVASSANSQLTFYHGDHLNSASTMTDGLGAVIGRQVLSPYGRKLSTGGYTGPIGLAGQRLDITGLYHMGAREMNPSLAIFVTPDPSGAPDPERPQTLSRYAYANNTPTNLVDPTGFEAKEPSFWQGFRAFVLPTNHELGTRGAAGNFLSNTRGVGKEFGNLGISLVNMKVAMDSGNPSNFIFNPAFPQMHINDNELAGAAGAEFVTAAVGAADGALLLRGAAVRLPGMFARRGARVIDGHLPGQGFSGVFDTNTGKVLIQPSTAEAVVPSGWVPRAGGHANVSSAMGGDAAGHSGFAAILQENGSLNLTWRSRTLNPGPGNLVPAPLRPTITDAVKKTTGRVVNN